MWFMLAFVFAFAGIPPQQVTENESVTKQTVLQGKTVLVGGGPTSPAAVRALLSLAGGHEAPIVILSQAEDDPVKGTPESLALYHAQGATHVEAPVNVPIRQILTLLAQARGVWIPGGDQNRFMTVFPESSGVPAAIRSVWKRGGVVGGTSAGASLMGDLMPTGAKVSIGLQEGTCPVSAGLSVLTDTIIDQHFITRNRMLRLLAAVLEHPDSRGIGLDEGSWATVENNVLKVGDGQVTLMHVIRNVHRNGKRLGTAGITLSVLLAGEQCSLLP